jgi:hypothetical protein
MFSRIFGLIPGMTTNEGAFAGCCPVELEDTAKWVLIGG